MSEAKKKICIPSVVSVKELAQKADLPVTVVMTELIKNGVLATINESIDFDTASIIGDDLGFEVEKAIEAAEVKVKNIIEKKDSAKLENRPPIVTVMGHVDHGKTSLLDSIRLSHVAEGESGGITQHISAYQVTLKNAKNADINNKTVTFIDTPGHAAFSAMRSHGATLTDIIILIVAANDGVKPQTEEVIKNAKDNNVPIIVAINKVDLPDADVNKTKQQLSEYDLVPEDWGGKVPMVEVSAKTKKGIDELLEVVLLQAEMMELKADPFEKAVGIVIESHMEKGAGSMATVLIENGTLHKGEPVSIGSTYGKVRIMEDFSAKPLTEAGPSAPIRIAGLKAMPDFGDRLFAFDSEKEASKNAYLATSKKSLVKIATAKKVDSGDESENRQTLSLSIVLKCDVKGSLEAVKQSILEISVPNFEINIIAEGVSAISESDITLAKATGALVLGFRVGILGAAKKIADKEGVKAKVFDVIYELIDYLKVEISNILPLLVIEEELGRGKVLAIFRDDKKGFVAGGKVVSGEIKIGDEIKFSQSASEKWRGKIASLRREKGEVKECQSGSECGFGLASGANVSVNDTFIAFKTVTKKQEVK